MTRTTQPHLVSSPLSHNGIAKWCGAALLSTTERSLHSPTLSYWSSSLLNFYSLLLKFYSMERYYFLQRWSYTHLVKFYSMESLLSLTEVYSTTFYWGYSTLIYLTNLNGQEILLQLTKKIKTKMLNENFCFSSHSWSVKSDVRSIFIYNPDLSNIVIIYIMKISSTLFLYKEVFS